MFDSLYSFFFFPFLSTQCPHSRGNHSRLRGDHLQVIRQITVRPLASWWISERVLTLFSFLLNPHSDSWECLLSALVFLYLCLFRNHFYQFGEIRTITVVQRQQCAFIQFATRQAAEVAAEKSFNKLIVNGRRLNVKWGRWAWDCIKISLGLPWPASG